MQTLSTVLKSSNELTYLKLNSKKSPNLSAQAAGAFIALGGVASSVVAGSGFSFGITKILSGLVFSIGLILVIFFGAELFTGNMTMVTALFDKPYLWKKLIPYLLWVYIGNWAGAFIFGNIAACAGIPAINNYLVGATAIKTMITKCTMSGANMFWSGFMCNILVCAAVYMARMSNSVCGKLVAAAFPVFIFVMCGFEHCIANLYYFSIGLHCCYIDECVKALSDNYGMEIGNISFLVFKNLALVTLGNILGGVTISAFLQGEKGGD